MYRNNYSSILALILFYLSHESQSICNFIYVDEVPYQLDTCIWNEPGVSYGYYCATSYNGTTYSEYQVFELQFPEWGCPGGIDSEDALVYNHYVCSDEDCHCDGTPDDCTIATERYYDFDASLIEGDNPGCNTSYYSEYSIAWDSICLARGDIGSIGFTCDDEYGVGRINYDDQSCSVENADIVTPSPTLDNPCRIYACEGDLTLPSWDGGYSGTEEKDNTLFIVIGLVVAVLVCCGCIAAIWCCIQRKQRKEVTFDHNNGGTTW